MAYHDEYTELISAALDGVLSLAQRETLEEHLASCPECGALYEELAALRAALSDLPPVEAPADLTGRVLSAVAAERAVPPVKAKAPLHWQRWLSSAAVLAVIAAGTWGWKPWGRGDVAGKTERKSAAPAAVQDAAPDNSQVLSGTPEAAPESIPDTTALFSEADGLPAEDAPTPDSGAYAGNGGIDPAGAPAESGKTALRMSRMTPEPESGEESAQTSDGSDAEEPMAPQTFGVDSNSLPAGTAAAAKALTSREALYRLLAEYPVPGCETWEYGELESGWRSPVWTANEDTCWFLYEGNPHGTAHQFLSYAEKGDELVLLGVFSVPIDGGEITASGT